MVTGAKPEETFQRSVVSARCPDWASRKSRVHRFWMSGPGPGGFCSVWIVPGAVSVASSISVLPPSLLPVTLETAVFV
jgi:hypothetical protein